jgi:F-type H+-transporting ATPase subunit gamma
MEMIANAKLFKQRQRMEANRQYAQKLQDTVNDIVVNNPDAQSRYIRKSDGNSTMAIVYCSDLGLCGSYNQNVLKETRKMLRKEDPIYLVGTSLFRSMKEEGFNIQNAEPISSDQLSFSGLKDLIEEATIRYVDGEVDSVKIIYTRFVNTMSFKAESDTLLPFEFEVVKKEGMHVETLFEPNPEEILESLIPMMINEVAYANWMESTTAEQGSRRVAMKTATDNADELSADLMLEYNKLRQAGITQEITEIVGGSAAV